jgi:hypothetical protein
MAEQTATTTLNVGDRVRLAHDSTRRRWWTVRAADGRYVVLTRQRDFRPKGELYYTIIDWERGVRGPCDLIGQGWDVESPGGCEALLRALGMVIKPGPVEEISVEVSYRNNVPIEVLEVRAAAHPTHSEESTDA